MFLNESDRRRDAGGGHDISLIPVGDADHLGPVSSMYQAPADEDEQGEQQQRTSSRRSRKGSALL